MSSSKKSDLKGDFAAAIYLFEAPSTARFFVLGWSSNFVGSESGQIPSVKLLEYMLSNTTRQPCCYTLYISCTFLHKEGEMRVETERRGEGQQGRVPITKLGRKYQHDF